VVASLPFRRSNLSASLRSTHNKKTKRNFEPIIQGLEFTNKLLSRSKFQVPGPGALVGERGT
jgi:hypothetical protein